MSQGLARLRVYICVCLFVLVCMYVFAWLC